MPNNAGFLLIAAISGRALAAAARRAGYRPLVADFFCDTDTTVALAERTQILPGDLQHGIDMARLVETLRELAGKDRPVALVLGSGFEHEPDVVDELARNFPLAGNDAAAIRRVKDPQMLAADCAELGIPHPEFRWEPPADPENWVVKTAGGAGGSHVWRFNGTKSLTLPQAAPSTAFGGPSPPLRRGGTKASRYFQRFVSGQSVSALFVGDGQSARIVGFSRQWTSPAPGIPYRYGGAVRLRRIDRDDAAAIGGWLDGLARRAGLAGLCSADFIRNGDGYQLVEINPRPGATLDIFDSIEAPLMEAHLRAARGEAYAVPRFADSMASMIAYAAAPVSRFPEIDWPDWTADHQSPGTRLVAGDPICTVFARGRNAAATRRIVQAQVKELQRCWEGDAT